VIKFGGCYYFPGKVGNLLMERPDLSQVDPNIRAYIDYLEEQLNTKKSDKHIHTSNEIERDEPISWSEPPTSINILTVTKNALGKRTGRHLYSRQRRGGMGVFDIDVPEPDYPSIILGVEENQSLLLFTDKARVFRQSLAKLPESPVRARGENLIDRLAFDPDEKLVAILPDRAQGYVALISCTGRVRCLRHHLFGEHMRPGTAMYHTDEFGPLASVCWTPGDADLFIVTRRGMAIRFGEKLTPPQGDYGIRLAENDQVVAITTVYPDSGVFLLGADGKGTVRSMSGFAPNKSLGGSGKIAIKNDQVVSAFSIEPNDDIFIISHLGKIIRFQADEVPPTEGVIQGVNCINLRADEVMAATCSSLNPI
jgi:DNA gyrase subunit A